MALDNVVEALKVVLLRFIVPPVNEMVSVADKTDDDWFLPILVSPPSIDIVVAYIPLAALIVPPVTSYSLILLLLVPMLFAFNSPLLTENLPFDLISFMYTLAFSPLCV